MRYFITLLLLFPLSVRAVETIVNSPAKDNASTLDASIKASNNTAISKTISPLMKLHNDVRNTMNCNGMQQFWDGTTCRSLFLTDYVLLPAKGKWPDIQGAWQETGGNCGGGGWHYMGYIVPVQCSAARVRPAITIENTTVTIQPYYCKCSSMQGYVDGCSGPLTVQNGCYYQGPANTPGTPVP